VAAARGRAGRAVGSIRARGDRIERFEPPWEIWRLPNQARGAWGKENPFSCQPPRSIPMS
jgi:hypothetical protein